MQNKDNFTRIVLIVLILIIIFLGWRIEYLNKKAAESSDDLKKSIIANDSLTKDGAGNYSKLVDYYKSESDLKKELKKSNEDLYKTIKKQDERILSLTNAVVSLEGAVNEGTGNTNAIDSNLIDLTLKYPEDKNPFITWNGSINKQTAYYKGEWSFGKLPLQIILTEEKRGLWKTRLIGPTWFKCDSLTINSLPAEQYTSTTERNIQFLFGGGYVKSLTPTGANAISVGGGVSIKDRHNIIINAGSNNTLGIFYYYKIRSFKKRK